MLTKQVRELDHATFQDSINQGARPVLVDFWAPWCGPCRAMAPAFERAAGELWRSRFDAARNIIVVNSGHRDFVFATRNRALQLRYLVRLYVKELVLRNFSGLPADQLLERMIELSLHAEANLKPG